MGFYSNLHAEKIRQPVDLLHIVRALVVRMRFWKIMWRIKSLKIKFVTVHVQCWDWREIHVINKYLMLEHRHGIFEEMNTTR